MCRSLAGGSVTFQTVVPRRGHVTAGGADADEAGSVTPPLVLEQDVDIQLDNNGPGDPHVHGGAR